MTKAKKQGKDMEHIDPNSGEVVAVNEETKEAVKGGHISRSEVLEAFLVKHGGDVGKLSPREGAKLILSICQELGLNPSTQPIKIMPLGPGGKKVLYALKDCTDQLRKIHGVSVTSMETSTVGDMHMVTVQVADRTGRTDMDTGAIDITSLKGEKKANALMKAVTKAKRRATLSICGLGIMDESEIEGAKAALNGGAMKDVTPDAKALNQPVPVSAKAQKALENMAAKTEPTPMDPLGDGSHRGPDEPAGERIEFASDITRESVEAEEAATEAPEHDLEKEAMVLTSYQAGLMGCMGDKKEINELSKRYKSHVDDMSAQGKKDMWDAKKQALSAS